MKYALLAFCLLADAPRPEVFAAPAPEAKQATIEHAFTEIVVGPDNAASLAKFRGVSAQGIGVIEVEDSPAWKRIKEAADKDLRVLVSYYAVPCSKEAQKAGVKVRMVQVVILRIDKEE